MLTNYKSFSEINLATFRRISMQLKNVKLLKKKSTKKLVEVTRRANMGWLRFSTYYLQIQIEMEDKKLIMPMK